MRKKQVTKIDLGISTVPVKGANVRAFDFSEADANTAASLGIVLAGSADACIDRAVSCANAAAALWIETGFLMLKAKSEAGHGEFEKAIESRGMDIRRAQEFMRIAKFYTSLDESQRRKVFALGKVKVQALAAADQDVVDDLLDEPDEYLSTLSVRGLRDEINALRAERNRIQTDLNTANAKLSVAHKTLPPPLISRETDAFLRKDLNAEAMGAAAHDILARQIKSIENGTEDIEERVMSLHCCLTALACRAVLALERLHQFASDSNVRLPERPRMAVSESMARDYLEAHTGYIQTAIEIAEKALIAHGEPALRGRGRPAGSKSKKGATQ